MLERACDSLPLIAPAIGLPILAVADVVSDGMPWASLSATGLLGWYLWYNTKHGIPALVDRHLAQIDQHRKEHAAQIERIDTIRRDEQQRFLAAIDSLNKTIQGLSCQSRQTHDLQPK